MEVIILRITNYKEKDGIIEAINNNQIMSFLARGIFDPKNKNALLNNPLTIVDIEIKEDKYKYPLITSSSLIHTPINLHPDLRYMASIMGIVEGINHLLNEEEKPLIYDDLKEAIIEIKNIDNPLKIVIPLFSKILKLSGYDFEVDGCSNCGKRKDIVTFSFNEGGFICGNCYTNDIPKLFNKNQMLFIRDSFLNRKSVIDINDDELLFVLNNMIEFIYDSYGYRIKSFDLLTK